MKFKLLSLAAAAALLSTGAGATEGGGSIYPVGSENYICCSLPPPGIYGMVYAERYHADTLRDNAGNNVSPPGFKVTSYAVVPRFVWVTPLTVAGASLALHTIVPLVNLDLKVAPGVGQTKTGIGDAVFGTGLSWHHSRELHTVAAFDVFTPTGAYSKGDIANIGRNYWAAQPLVGVSYVQSAGLNADAKVMWTFNSRNKDTDYRSGQEFIVDYAIGWGLGNGWTVGAGGYLYQQVTDDRQAGVALANHRGRAFAIGPSIKYDSGKGWFLTAKVQKETSVRNRSEGNAFWIKAVFPL